MFTIQGEWLQHQDRKPSRSREVMLGLAAGRSNRHTRSISMNQQYLLLRL
jgi:hypothetical protein